MKKLFVVLISSLGLTSPLYAEFAPKLNEICTPSPATHLSKSHVDNKKILGMLYKNQAIQDIDIDTSGAAVDRVSAVLDPDTFCKPGRCTDDGAKALKNANGVLIGYTQRHRGEVRSGEAGYQFKFGLANLESFLTKGTGAPECIVPTPPPGAQPPIDPPKQDEARVPLRLIVRKNVTDLNVSQGNTDAFQNLDRASLSIVNNRIQQSTAYDLQAVVGVGIGQMPIGTLPGNYLELIPYFSINRQQTTGNAPDDAANVYNLGGGLLADFLFRIGEVENSLASSVNYTNSQRSGARIANGAIVYTPNPNARIIPGIGTYTMIGPLKVTVTPRLKYVFGAVLNDGGDPNLVGTKDFQRYGGRVEFAASVPSLVKGLGFNAGYEFLKNSGGTNVHNIERFEASSSYTFPEQEYWSLLLKYVNGRDLDTLERERKVTFGIGLKY